MKQSKYVFRNLIFEGGGVKGIAYAGALQALNEKGILDSVTRIAGTSAGAITAACVAVGFTPEEIKNILMTTPFSEFKDDSFFFIRDLLGLYKRFGWYKGDFFMQWFESILARKAHKNITFKELAETDGMRELYVVGTDLNNRREFVFSHETTPNMPVAKAVRISMSIPLFFKSVRLGTNTFVDGGLYYNYPINMFDNLNYLSRKQHSLPAPYDPRDGAVYNKETLGLRVDDSEEIKHHLEGMKLPRKKIRGLQDYIQILVGSLVDTANKKHIHKNDWHRTIHVNSLGVGATEFTLSDEKKHALIASGVKGVTRYFAWYDKPPKNDRPINK